MYKYSIQYFCDKLGSVCEKQRPQGQVSTNEVSGESLKKNVCFSIDNTDLRKAHVVGAPYLEADPEHIESVEVSKGYTPDPAGRALLEQEYAQPIDAAKARIFEIETKKERILLGSVAVRLARFLEQTLFWPLVILIVVPSVSCLIFVGPKSFFFTFLFGIMSFRSNLDVTKWRNSTCDCKLEEDRSREGTKTNRYFWQVATYPPDWEYRREAAKERDKYSCTKCGYPAGFKRRSLQLHVHHNQPVAKGGTHEIENLITLCHMCHRKVDASHSRVRRTPSPPRRRYR